MQLDWWFEVCKMETSQVSVVVCCDHVDSAGFWVSPWAGSLPFASNLAAGSLGPGGLTLKPCSVVKSHFKTNHENINISILKTKRRILN